jgi:hypothetical protein
MSYLYQPYKPTKERKIKIIDIEGYRDFKNDIMIPYLVGVYDRDFFYHYKDTECVNQFIDKFISHQNRGSVFYAHFGSIFDFPILLQELNKRPFNIYPIMKGSKIIKITLMDDNGHRWYLQDSSALLNFSLDELTKTFKVAHKKLHVIEKNDSYDMNLYKLYLKDPKTVIEYLKHDCIGLYEVLENFKKEILDIGGNMGLTIASTSLKTFNHKYQKNPLYMCSKELNDELRLAYYGGRTEIFIMYAPPQKNDYYSYYDINSLYPTVMEKNRYPISAPLIHKLPDKRLIMEEDGITFAKVKAPEKLYIPLLPAKVKVGYDNKLMFLLGSFEGYWDNHLLRKAIEIGYKVEPIKSYTFETEYIFKDFIHDFYKIKQESEKDTPMYLIAKLLMNSLYGKFGQHQICELMIKDPNPDKEKYKIKEYDVETGWARVEEEGKGKSYLPQIAVHVTAMAQLFLYESIEKILEKDYRVFYCDTDSMITDYNNMRTSKVLGDWKLEKKVIAGYFVLPKTYKIIGEEGKIELRAKGYSRKLQAKISSGAFEEAIMQENFKGFTVISDKKEMLRAKSSFRRFGDFNRLDYVRKSIQSKYNKRKILKNLDTWPFDITELI